ncbi:hypothetical protein JCM11491_002209 [Sporobolomyces phaffii]
MSPPLDAHVTLSTSDDPAELLSVPRASLVAHSRVFAEMLSLELGSDRPDGAIPLSETSKEIKPFLALLEDSGEDQGAILQELDEEGWKDLARLADKYDVWTFRNIIEAHAWELYATAANPRLSFVLATTTTNRDLIKRTIQGTALVGLTSDSSGLTPEWEMRLDAYHDKQKAYILNNVQSYSERVPEHHWHGCHTKRRCNWVNAWEHALGQCLGSFCLSEVPPLSVTPKIRHQYLCSAFKGDLEEHAAEFERAISKWVDFDY